jgi:hypothetical protein
MSSMIGIYSGGDPTSIGDLLTLIQAGCYTNVILWAAHVDGVGNIKQYPWVSSTSEPDCMQGACSSVDGDLVPPVQVTAHYPQRRSCRSGGFQQRSWSSRDTVSFSRLREKLVHSAG